MVKPVKTRTIYVELPDGEKPSITLKGYFTNTEVTSISHAIKLENTRNKIKAAKEARTLTQEENDDE